jgi:hypothetical protein
MPKESVEMQILQMRSALILTLLVSVVGLHPTFDLLPDASRLISGQSVRSFILSNEPSDAQAQANDDWQNYFESMYNWISSSDQFPSGLDIDTHELIDNYLGGAVQPGFEMGATFPVTHMTYEGQSSLSVLKFDNVLRAAAAVGFWRESFRAFGWLDDAELQSGTSFLCQARTLRGRAESICLKSTDDIVLVSQLQVPSGSILQVSTLVGSLTAVLDASYETVGPPPNTVSDTYGDETFLFTSPDSLLPQWIELSDWEVASPVIRSLSFDWFTNAINWKGSLETDRQRHLLACGIRDGAESYATGGSNLAMWANGTAAYRFNTTEGASECFGWMVSLTQFNDFYQGQLVDNLGEQAFFGHAMVSDLVTLVSVVRVAELVFVFTQQSYDDRAEEFITLIRTTFQSIPWLNVNIDASVFD